MCWTYLLYVHSYSYYSYSYTIYVYYIYVYIYWWYMKFIAESLRSLAEFIQSSLVTAPPRRCLSTHNNRSIYQNTKINFGASLSLSGSLVLSFSIHIFHGYICLCAVCMNVQVCTMCPMQAASRQPARFQHSYSRFIPHNKCGYVCVNTFGIGLCINMIEKNKT